LLLEAGPRDKNPWIHIPLGYAKTYVDPSVNRKFETEPQPQMQMQNRRLYLPRGKTLGGSSSINGMLYIRGHHADYDEWRQRGCIGWDWNSVLPYFKKAENQARGGDAYHGTDGPRHVSDQPERSELSSAVLQACVPAGIPATPDFNGAQQEGCCYYQTTTNNGRRWSAAKAYLSNPPSNLTIQTNAQATRVLIENGRATGVEYHSAAGRVADQHQDMVPDRCSEARSENCQPGYQDCRHHGLLRGRFDALLSHRIRGVASPSMGIPIRADVRTSLPTPRPNPNRLPFVRPCLF
jgi:choline dehydrogenase-like flavoprotein